MSFYAYLLRCADGSYYAGHTECLEARVGQHATGACCAYTRRRRPVALVWSQDFPSRIEALEAERRIKGWSRAKKEALIADDWTRLSELARSRQGAGRSSTSSGRTEDLAEAVSSSPVRPEPVEGRAPVNDVRQGKGSA